MNPSKELVLKYLTDNAGEYLSGEELSTKLSLSRTAVWKHVQALRQAGYKIEATPRRGYRLIGIPDLLLPVEITRHLKTKTLGRRIYYHKRIGSTSDLAKELAMAGAPEGTLVVAEEQTRGRGRLDRQWLSPKGGIWSSLILRPSINPIDAPKITLLAAIGLAEAIGQITGLDARTKWPNDVLIARKKVAGILTEMDAELDRIHHLVLGVGINANFGMDRFPSQLGQEVTTLRKELNKDVPRVALLARFLERFEQGYFQLIQGKFDFLIEEWLKLDQVVGKEIRVATAEGILEGKALGINEHGALIFQDKNGEKKLLSAGEVTMAGLTSQ